MPSLTCYVLASADDGAFNSARPVALHEVCGKTLLDRVLAALPKAPVVLCGPAGSEALAQAAAERGLAGEPPDADDELVLVVPAEMPLLDPADLTRLVETAAAAPGSAVTLGPLWCGPPALRGVEPSAVADLPPSDRTALLRVTTRAELARAESILRDRVRARLLASGVTLIDPAAVYADEDVQVGRDTTIYPGTVLQGAVTIGEGCQIGPRACIINSTVGDRTRVQDGAMVRDSAVGSDALIGHCSHVRSHSNVGDGCELGSFAEVARAVLEPGVNQLHFSFLGDAHVARGANIGAGAITCNFDGTSKHETQIGEGAFVGSGAVLIAPLTVGRGSYVAAGSAITHDVPPGALAFGRARQSVKENWSGPSKRQDEPQS
jgi:bifunctional N-acetylglucosamine-1-phosphate-uridyltransferase/glucosamine-1-phosphate-acetyltransferase GlmU-like protein